MRRYKNHECVVCERRFHELQEMMDHRSTKHTVEEVKEARSQMRRHVEEASKTADIGGVHRAKVVERMIEKGLV